MKQSAPGMDKGQSSKFWLLRSTNLVKFIEDWVMCTEKHILILKNDTYKWIKHGFATSSPNRNDSP